jgi:uncharacterized protein (DUF433 family)
MRNLEQHERPLVSEIVGGKPYEYYPLGDYVVRSVGVCGGRPTFKYTRIEIAGTLERLGARESIDEIVAGYRGRVPREAIVEAVRLATEQQEISSYTAQDRTQTYVR